MLFRAVNKWARQVAIHDPTFRRFQPNVFVDTPKALIVDLGGTIVDPFVLAPALAFQKLFELYGIEVSMKTVRGPMGMRKDLHIDALLQKPKVRMQWIEKYGSEPKEEDIQKMYHDFKPIQMELLSEVEMISDVSDVLNSLRHENPSLQIGCTTGFNRKMTELILQNIKDEFVPDTYVAGDQVPDNLGNRPAPFMLYQNLIQMGGIFPIQSVIKVDDTITGVEEGINAGCWSIGVAGTSNYMEIDSMEQYQSMSKEEIDERLQYSREMLWAAHPNYVIDDLTQLPRVFDEITRRLQDGQTPSSVPKIDF